ncbi:MAG: hypothetical protein ACREA0_00995 [bacterium]
MNSDYISAAVGVVLGAAFLYAFFRAIQLNWPESYFGVGELAAYAISASPVRYTLFRFGPVYGTALFAGVATDRVGTDGFVTATGVGVLHALLTSGWGLLQAVRWPAEIRRRRRPILVVRVVVLLGVVGVSALAGVSRGVFAAIVPPISEISATLWTGIIAGVLGAFVVRVSRGHPVHEHEMVERARQEIPRRLWLMAARVALERGADVDLVRAVMIVEHLQRPAWFRRAERLKGRFQPRGSYGIMQIQADRPLTDEESIERAVTERLAGVRIRNEHGWVDDDALAAFARSYNPSSDYRTLLDTAYGLIRQTSSGYRSAIKADDHRPIIEIDVFEQLDGLVRLEGSAVVYEGTVEIMVVRKDEMVHQVTEQASRGAPFRGVWSVAIEVPRDATALVVGPSEMEETPEDVRAGSRATVELEGA